MHLRLPPAKINLFLRIVGRRADGFHEIETLFQAIDLTDRLEFERTESEGLELICKGRKIGCEETQRNLVLRAWEALRPYCTARSNKPNALRVTLEKRIAVGGGLGGGSSDAAAALLAFNDLLSLGLRSDELGKIALSLGADVPFFLDPGAAVGRGVGERLTPVRHRARFWCVLAIPPYGVSTAEVYKRFDPAGKTEDAGKLDLLLAALERADLDATLAHAHNAMEPLAFAIHPELGHLRDDLEAMVERPVRMSGSGSTLFTLAESRDEADRIAAQWKSLARTEAAQFLDSQKT